MGITSSNAGQISLTSQVKASVNSDSKILLTDEKPKLIKSVKPTKQSIENNTHTNWYLEMAQITKLMCNTTVKEQRQYREHIQKLFNSFHDVTVEFITQRKERYNWETGFTHNSIFYKRIITKEEKKKCKSKYKMLRYYALYYFNSTNNFQFNNLNIYVMLPITQLIELEGQMFIAQPAILNDHTNPDPIYLRKYQVINNTMITKLITTFQKITIVNPNIPQNDRFFIVDHFEYPLLRVLDTQIQIPNDIHLPIEIEYRLYLGDDRGLYIQKDDNAERNVRACYLMGLDLRGDVTIDFKPYPLSISLGMILENGYLERVIQLKQGNNPDVIKTLIQYYKDQITEFNFCVDYNFYWIAAEMRRKHIKQSMAWLMYLKTGETLQKECLASMIVVNAIKKYPIVQSLKHTIVDLIKGRFIQLEQIMFQKVFDLSAFYPMLQEKQIYYLLSPQSSREIMMFALQNATVLSQAILWRFGLTFNDPILRLIKSDIHYFILNHDNLSPDDLYYLSYHHELYHPNQDFAHLYMAEETCNHEPSMDDVGEVQLPFPFYRLVPIKRSPLFKSSYSIGNHMIFQNDLNQIDLKIYRLLISWSDETDLKLIDELINLMSISNNIQPYQIIIISILKALKIETSDQIDILQQYITSMVLLFEVLGDPRGRGNNVDEIHKFVIAKIGYHSKDLSPENQNLLYELLECSPLEDISQFEKITLIELKPWILRWLNNLRYNKSKVTFTSYIQNEKLAKRLGFDLLKQNYWLCQPSQGSVMSWGYNTNGQVGIINHNEPIDNIRVLRPRIVRQLGSEIITSVSCGHKHTLALNIQGYIYAWGANDQGQCGLSPQLTKNLWQPKRMECQRQFQITSCGSDHSVALDQGRIYSWGSGEGGLLGLGTTEDHYSPQLIAGLEDIIIVKCGGLHTMAIKKNGELYAWGRNEGGQLGIANNTIYQTIPQLVQLPPVCQVALGDAHSLALTYSGTVFAWGYSNVGQLGIGIDDEHHDGEYFISQPVQVEYLNKYKIAKVIFGFFRQIFSGAMASLFLTDQNELFSCGLNDMYQSGHPSSQEMINYKGKQVPKSTLPQKILLQQYPIIDIASGHNHTICVQVNGRRQQIYSWGSDKQSQLGRNTTSSKFLPPGIIHCPPISSVAVGAYHTVMVVHGQRNLLNATQISYPPEINTKFVLKNQNYPSLMIFKL